MRLRALLFILSFILSLTVANTMWATPTEEIISLFKQLNTLEGEFKQTLYNQHHQVISVSMGNFVIERPDKFIWNVVSPSAQKSISNGKVVWIYQPDLEQATITPLTQQISATPLAILSGSILTLQKAYRIEKINTPLNQSTLFILHAKDADSPFTTIRLYFTDHVLTTMELTDTLDQKTHIDFFHIKTNKKFEDTIFMFAPPEGTDIIRKIA